MLLWTVRVKACKKTNTKVVERRRWKLKKLGRRLFPRTRRKYKDKTISVPLSSRLCLFGNNKRLWDVWYICLHESLGDNPHNLHQLCLLTRLLWNVCCLGVWVEKHKHFTSLLVCTLSVWSTVSTLWLHGSSEITLIADFVFVCTWDLCLDWRYVFWKPNTSPLSVFEVYVYLQSSFIAFE